MTELLSECKGMREEYDIENLNPRKNPYSQGLKKQMNVNDAMELLFSGSLMFADYPAGTPMARTGGIFFC